MKPKWLLLTIGLVAIGMVLIVLGTLIISENFRASLAVGIEDGRYYLLSPSKAAMQAGVLITASGVIAVSVSLASMITFWKGGSQIRAVAASQEE